MKKALSLFPARWSGRRRFAAAAAVLAVFLFFYPFRRDIALPGEVRSAVQSRLIAREGCFVAAHPGEAGRSFRRGERVFVLDAPLLRFAREKIEYMLVHDRLLFEQQRSSRATIGDSLLTGRRIASDLFAASELDRKIASGVQTAECDGIFIPAVGRVSRGFLVKTGTVLGTFCSGPKMVRAYATDQDVRFLHPGQRVRLLLRDRIGGVPGKIGAVHPIPAFLRDSPALQCFGGEIPVDVDAETPEDLHSLHPVYAVDVIPDRELDCQYGRFVRAEAVHRAMLASRIGSLVVSALRREFL
ncbi:MAG: hypothetical protein IJU70_06185 [Lentisphaeria bacterium]|nr:hypothetical protein [Lentisphaeria bacterium]